MQDFGFEFDRELNREHPGSKPKRAPIIVPELETNRRLSQVADVAEHLSSDPSGSVRTRITSGGLGAVVDLATNATNYADAATDINTFNWCRQYTLCLQNHILQGDHETACATLKRKCDASKVRKFRNQ